MSINRNSDFDILEKMQRDIDNYFLEAQMKEFFVNKERQRIEKRSRIINNLFYGGLRDRYLLWHKKQSYYTQVGVEATIATIKSLFIMLVWIVICCLIISVKV